MPGHSTPSQTVGPFFSIGLEPLNRANLADGRAGERVVVPVNSLLFRSEGLRAVVVGSDDRAHLQPLVIGRDYGNTLEVLSGLKPDQWIVLNPPDSLEDGQVVKVKQVANPTLPPPANAPANNPRKSASSTAPAEKKP